jgi:hypothetical protein
MRPVEGNAHMAVANVELARTGIHTITTRLVAYVTTPGVKSSAPVRTNVTVAAAV